MSGKFKQLFFLIILAGALSAPRAFALAAGEYPKLANYYLKFFNSADYDQLARWDLVITPPEMVYYNPEFFDLYRKKKKDGLLISYIYPAMVDETDLGESTGLHYYLHEGADENNWWLRDLQGGRLEVWPNIYAVNVTDQGWQDYNLNYIKDKIELDKWDGIMYDMVDGSIAHYNKKSTGIDIDNDGIREDQETVNRKWDQGMAALFDKTRKELGNKLILINGNSLDAYQPEINGRMFETFPTPWEGDGSWTASMRAYLKTLPGENKSPKIYVLNSNSNNSGLSDNYRRVRFGLASALLGDGYFSYDSGDRSHAQLWWYDEYNVRLGKAEGQAYNLLDRSDPEIKPGLWRRDFDFGTAFVNSTDQTQKYVFKKEEFEKIRGTQDQNVNDGTKVNWLKLQPNDGIILLKEKDEIIGNSFDNGSFVRLFDRNGSQVRNGFFAYKDNYPGNTEILASDLDNDGQLEYLVNGGGTISVYKNGKKIRSFQPFSGCFKGKISFIAEDLNGDGQKEIIAGAGQGGGPQIRIFSKDGRLLSGGFFAYDKRFRGGVHVAGIDLFGDGRKEIITGAGPGGGPHVRVFSEDGKELLSFFAYDKNFRGGVSVAAGDIDGDGEPEIITGAGAGGGPQVNIYDRRGRLKSHFFAFDKNFRSGISVMASDIDGDGTDEILVSTTGL